ncbi:MAG: hypothetical protein WBV06_06465 [Acidimicrobiia bacterium]|jgi:hypothetical protein
MFAFSGSPFPIPSSIVSMCQETWTGLATPGSVWSGADRVAMARLTRAARLRLDTPATGLPAEIEETVRTLSASPSATSQAFVESCVTAVGEPAYVELVGLVARVVAVDTFSRLVGVAPEPFPDPVPGAPVAVAPAGLPKRGKTWVSMTDLPVPPNVLSLVPPAQAATNVTAETLYMTGAQMEDPDTTIDDLHRTQIEIVASTVSHANNCFY